jgi:Raf kinase inhibitor-like YbhB/YbcL family protein
MRSPSPPPSPSPSALVALACALACALASALAILACGKPPIVPRTAPGASLASITVTSPAFTEGAGIPVDQTCDGQGVMPAIVLSSPPEGTKSLVLIVDDPDAPDGTFTHLVLFDLSPELRKLPAGSELPPQAGPNARFGLNDFQVAHYSGPCPPKGELHRYRWRVVALDTVINLPEGTPRSQIDEAMDGHILGEGTLTGLFGH